MSNWAAAEEQARGHWGVITLEQFVALGFKWRAIEWAVKSGRLVRLFRGAFRFAVVAPRWEQNAYLATCMSGKGGALSHATAASVWGLSGFGSSYAPIHVSLPGRRRINLPGGTFVVHRPKGAFEPYTRNGFIVTRLARTIIDIAESVGDARLEIILDAAQQRFCTLQRWLTQELLRHRRKSRPGLGRLIALLDARGGVATESPLETQFRRRLRLSDLPPPQLQFNISDSAGFIMRADAAWPAHLVAVHMDSFLWHGGRARLDRDAQQRRRLTDAGWISIVVTSADLANDEWLQQLSRTLQRRAPQRELFANLSSRAATAAGCPARSPAWGG